MRIVASCTTLPDRYDSLLKTLKCLQNQSVCLDAIYLTIPYIAKRMNKVYPEIPDEIKKICIIVRCEEDYGPLCKLYGALLKEKDPNTIIISIDDDCLYPIDLVKTLLYNYKKSPNNVICASGVLLNNGVSLMSYYTNDINASYKSLFFNIPLSGRYIDVLYGFSGVLYKRSFFPLAEHLDELFKYPSISNVFFRNDDIVISCYLRKKGIKIKIFNNIPSIIHGEKNENALSYNYKDMINNFDESINLLKKYDMIEDFEQVYISESPWMKGFYFVLLIIFIILYIYLIMMNYI